MTRCSTRITRLKNDFATMSNEYEALEVQMRGEADDCASRITTAENERASLSEQVHKLEMSLKESRLAHDGCKQEISALEDERDELKLEVSSSYDTSSDEYVSWLSNIIIVVG